jgi:hypothetical protein
MEHARRPVVFARAGRKALPEGAAERLLMQAAIAVYFIPDI